MAAPTETTPLIGRTPSGRSSPEAGTHASVSASASGAVVTAQPSAAETPSMSPTAGRPGGATLARSRSLRDSPGSAPAKSKMVSSLAPGKNTTSTSSPQGGTITVTTGNAIPVSSPSNLAARAQAKVETRAPKRTTKTSQKLTVFPAANLQSQKAGPSGLKSDSGDGRGSRVAIPNLPHVSSKALEEEWLSKLEKRWLPRCTAYCTANSYDIPKLLHFLGARTLTHRTDPKRFDEVIHTPYAVPDQQIGAARSTWLNDQYILDYINNVPGSIEYLQPLLRQRKKTSHLYYSRATQQQQYQQYQQYQHMGMGSKISRQGQGNNSNSKYKSYSPHRMESSSDLGNGIGGNNSNVINGGINNNDDSYVNLDEEETIAIQGLENFFEQNVDANGDKLPTTIPHSQLAKRIAPIGELLFFDYGVVVMWGLSWEEEQIVLNDISQFEEQKLASDDVEVEEFHFHYNIYFQPRIYNDIITLKNPQNYMIRLTISHAIAQSVKLVLFEGLVDDTIDGMRHIPLILSETGKIQMSRKQVNKKIAQLFIMRINVNLVSNVLDTPEIFWSEPALEPLYMAIRGYLEIPQRVDVLNQRVTVISDMLDMLKDNQTNTHGEQLEWIVIILIGIEIIIGLATTGIDLFAYARGTVL